MTKEKYTEKYTYEYLKNRKRKVCEMFTPGNDGVFIGDREDIHALEFEIAELKELLKECVENFPTKEFAERVYSIDGIERQPPKIIEEKKDEEIPF